MLKFGDMSSVLQISVALNLAYFSFREIRTPASFRHERVLRRTDDIISRALALYLSVPKPQEIKPFAEETSIWIKADNEARRLNLHIYNQNLDREPFTENIREFDRYFRYMSVGVAGLAMAFLVLCSAISSTPVDVVYFLVITGICLTPTILVIFYNWVIGNMVEKVIDDIVARGKIVEGEMTQFSQALATGFSAPQ